MGYTSGYQYISENITPIGDGNPVSVSNHPPIYPFLISENITPIGDGNL